MAVLTVRNFARRGSSCSEVACGAAWPQHGSRGASRLSTYTLGLKDIFANRILSFDIEAAHHYGGLAIAARKRGQGFPVPDGYIAAIAASHVFAIATRDTAPFASVGLTVIDPWRMSHSE